jgi:hypothetical protein
MNPEAVTERTIRYDVPRVFGIWFQLSPQLTDHDAKVFEVSVVVSLPDSVGKLPVTHRFVRVSNQILQDAEFLRSQMSQTATGARHFPRLQIHNALGEY